MKNVRKYRGLAGLTMAELAQKIGVSRTSLGEMEKDQKYIAHDEVTRKLCKALEVNVYDIYSVDEILRFYPVDKAQAAQLIDMLKKEFGL